MIPIEILNRIMDCQEEQGNPRNQTKIYRDKDGGGFNWVRTKEGYDFWFMILANKNYKLFYETYPKSVFKLGLDIHGVITKYPQQFKHICQSILYSGDEVHILTGATTSKALNELNNLGYKQGIHFTKLMSVPEYLKLKGYEPIGYNKEYENDEYHDSDWNNAKALYCEENKIELFFDDKESNLLLFTTPNILVQ